MNLKSESQACHKSLPHFRSSWLVRTSPPSRFGDGGAATDTADEALSVDIVEAIGVRDEARAAEEGGAAAGTDAEATPVNDAEADGRDDGVHAAGGAEPGGTTDAS